MRQCQTQEKKGEYVFFLILKGLYDICLWLNEQRFFIDFFLFERYEQLLLSVFFYRNISCINVKIIRSKFKNNQNFRIFYPPPKKDKDFKDERIF